MSRFEWQVVPDAYTYSLEVATGAVFDPANVVAWWDTLATTSVRPSNVLGYGQTFSWRMQAQNPNGDGPWSTPRSFTTTTTDQPLGPQLEAPYDGAVLPGTKLEWTAYPAASLAAIAATAV